VSQAKESDVVATINRTGVREPAAGALRCRRKFLRIFPGGFRDPEYIELERDYKWQAHQRWLAALDQERFEYLLRHGGHREIAAAAIAVESRTNLLFSFEKMALRDAVRTEEGARRFSEGLYDFLHGSGEIEDRFFRWCASVAGLPRRQTRVLTWPLVTVFGFLAQPLKHIFLKPRVTQFAAERYGYDFKYSSKPSWTTYASLLDFATDIRRVTRDLGPRDYIDVQSFIWVQGSEEYEE
jgi:hypothetical protein